LTVVFAFLGFFTIVSCLGLAFLDRMPRLNAFLERLLDS
jgi:hypothetical protein